MGSKAGETAPAESITVQKHGQRGGKHGGFSVHGVAFRNTTISTVPPVQPGIEAAANAFQRSITPEDTHKVS